MNRATLVYLGMIVVFVAGLWAVLSVGATLSAPENLDGRWVALGPADGSPPGTWSGLTVGQSGRYFQLAFDGGPTVAVTADPPGPDGRLTLTRHPWHVTVTPAAADARTFRVEGPTPGTFVGHRDRPTTVPAAG